MIPPARLRGHTAPFLFAALLALAGCATPPELADSGPVRAPTNFRGPSVWPEEMLRVAVLPAHDASGRLPPEFVAAHDAAWARALAATARAEFVAVPRTTLADLSGRETLDSTSPLPRDLLPRLAAETGAQGLLFLDLVHISPYPPLALAFRARLVSLDDATTVWMADENFDTRDAATARAARREARAETSTAGDSTAALRLSPTRLAEHAFGAVAALLPPRRALAPAPAGGALRAKQFPARADSPKQPNGVPSTPDPGLTVHNNE